MSPIYTVEGKNRVQVESVEGEDPGDKELARLARLVLLAAELARKNKPGDSLTELGKLGNYVPDKVINQFWSDMTAGNTGASIIFTATEFREYRPGQAFESGKVYGK